MFIYIHEKEEGEEEEEEDEEEEGVVIWLKSFHWKWVLDLALLGTLLSL